MKSYRIECQPFDSQGIGEPTILEFQAPTKNEAKKLYLEQNNGGSFKLITKVFQFVKKRNERKQMATRFYAYKKKSKKDLQSTGFGL